MRKLRDLRRLRQVHRRPARLSKTTEALEEVCLVMSYAVCNELSLRRSLDEDKSDVDNSVPLRARLFSWMSGVGRLGQESLKLSESLYNKKKSLNLAKTPWKSPKRLRNSPKISKNLEKSLKLSVTF